MESVPWLVGSAEVLLCAGCIFVAKYRVGCWEMEKQHDLSCSSLFHAVIFDVR